MRPDDAYTDWQVHYETCVHCRPYQPCPVGERLKQRDGSGTGPELVRDSDGTDTGVER